MSQDKTKGPNMTLIRWALVFFIVAIVAAVFGFTGIAAAAIEIGRILFFVFLVLFIVFLVLGKTKGRPPRIP